MALTMILILLVIGEEVMPRRLKDCVYQGADVRSVQLHLLGELASTVSTIQRIHLNSSIHETLIPLFQSTKLFRNLSSFSLNLYP